MYRVMEEIEEVVGDKTTVEADDLDKLTYMNQVSITIVLYVIYGIRGVVKHEVKPSLYLTQDHSLSAISHKSTTYLHSVVEVYQSCCLNMLHE